MGWVFWGEGGKEEEDLRKDASKDGCVQRKRKREGITHSRQQRKQRELIQRHGRNWVGHSSSWLRVSNSHRWTMADELDIDRGGGSNVHSRVHERGIDWEVGVGVGVGGRHL